MRSFNRISSSASTKARRSLINPAIRKARKLRRNIKLELEAPGTDDTEHDGDALGALDDNDDKACDLLSDAEVADCHNETTSNSITPEVYILIVTHQTYE